MLDWLSFTHFCALKNHTFVSLTLEFLISLVYTTQSWTASTIGIVKLCMFNKEYDFNLDQMTDLLQFPHGEGVICETHLDKDWVHEVGPLWEQLTGNRAASFEGNKTTQIHNLAVCYFRQILAHTIYGRDNESRINCKELFYIYSISFGGVITSIARSLGLDMKLSTLDPLPMLSLDIDACRHMQLIKNMRDEIYSLMIGNKEVPSIVLPCPNRTDV